MTVAWIPAFAGMTGRQRLYHLNGNATSVYGILWFSARRWRYGKPDVAVGIVGMGKQGVY